MKSKKNNLPDHLKVILKEIGVRNVDSASVQEQLQERAAMQVQDYVHVMCMKLSHFSGPSVTSPVTVLMQILDDAAAAPKRQKR
jgi:hypothetical protein